MSTAARWRRCPQQAHPAADLETDVRAEPEFVFFVGADGRAEPWESRRDCGIMSLE